MAEIFSVRLFPIFVKVITVNSQTFTKKPKYFYIKLFLII